MTGAELRNKLTYLINKYVPKSERDSFYDCISKKDVPINGILADFNKFNTTAVD